MFRSKSPLNKQLGVTILAQGTTFTGTLYCRGISRVGGRVEGQIASEGTLIIEQDAEIIADITAETLIIQGVVTGKVQAAVKTELLASSRLQGELNTPSLVMAVGTVLNAVVRMDEVPQGETAVSAPPGQDDEVVDVVQPVKKVSPVKLVVDATRPAAIPSPAEVVDGSSSGSVRQSSNMG